MKRQDAIKCINCKKEITNYERIINDGLCDNCKDKKREQNRINEEKEEKRKNRNAKIIFSVIAIIILFISIPTSIIQFNYDLGKCNNLKSSESSYDFTNRIEIDAKYNEDCYYLNNYPLAFAGYLLVAFLIPILLSIFGYLIYTIIKSTNYNYRYY